MRAGRLDAVSRAKVLCFLTLSIAAFPCATTRANAQDPTRDEAGAQVLFDEGKRLAQDSHYVEACPKLEESQRLAPGIGTKFQLADCYEHVGRTASAWAAFLDVAALTRVKGQHDREQAARERAASLEPRLSRLLVSIAAERRVEGLAIARDGVAMGAALWGVAVPVDPGAHVIAATAPQRKPWQTSVDVRGEGKTTSVDVPVLEALAAPDAPPTAPPSKTSQTSQTTQTPPVATAEPSSTQRTWAVVVGALGLAGVGVGAYFGLRSASKRDDASLHCSGDACDPSGIALRDDALHAGDASTLAFGIGAAALAGGVVLYLTSRDASPRAPVTLSVSPRAASLGVRW